MHALVATGATSQAMWEGELMRPDLKRRVQDRLVGQNSMDSLTFKAETARLINEKLSDPVEAASDATIAAVSILASTEVSPLLLFSSLVALTTLKFCILNCRPFHNTIDNNPF
jgi:hypothetical protein